MDEDSQPAVLRILFADDDVDVLRAVARVLTRGGHEVTACETAEEAIRFIGTGASIDLLLLDYSLGKGTWYVDLGNAARQTSPTVETMLLSGENLADVELVDRVAFIEKPVRPADLLAAIARMCARD